MFYNLVLILGFKSKGNIRVFCHCRPLNKVEMSVGCTTFMDFDEAKDGCLGILTTDSSAKKTFRFDRVYTPKDDQVDVFANAPSMEYSRIEESITGLLSICLEDLLAIGPASKRLEIKQSSEGYHHVPGVVEAKVDNICDVWNVLQTGSDVGSVKASIDGLKITHSAHDEKQLMSPTRMTPPTSVISITQACKESQNNDFITSPGLLHGQQYTYVNSPALCLSSSNVQKHVEEPSRISVKLNSGNATPIVRLPSLTRTAGDANTASFSVAVKQEFIQHSIIKPSNSTVSNSKLVDSTVIKFEPCHEGSQERSKTAKSTATAQLSKVLPQISLSSSASMTGSIVMNSTQISAKGTHPAVKAVCTPLLTSSNIIGQPENCSRAGVNVEKACEKVSSNPEHVPLVTVAFSMVGTDFEMGRVTKGLMHTSSAGFAAVVGLLHTALSSSVVTAEFDDYRIIQYLISGCQFCYRVLTHDLLVGWKWIVLARLQTKIGFCSPTSGHTVIAILQDCTIRFCDFDLEQTSVLHSPEKKTEQISSDAEVHMALTPLQPVVFFGFPKRMSVTVVGTVEGNRTPTKINPEL
ncbi:hypothetical protein KIW84_035216 [Lathyrus oleraceus]|uniref:Spindle pole body-associated protein Vik1/Cik1 microtubule binding domain-containing protein n=1 Tax=Pisum sativum TaxID=3888 RepID=A0A9D4Y351_PEA|nr:hypothetical protein KIW84_035216 [Pisum sativum]